ncbi:retrovirus-related pol polyprotein from transposon TNT 1-94 [Tanacetum coccineum]
MELYMQNREYGRMILESVEHGPLIWPTIEENNVTRTKKYEELSATEKIQVDCDLKATNIILQGLPSDVYSLVNHHRVAEVNEQINLAEFPQIDSGLAVPVFKQGDDPIDVINKMMSFLANISGTGENSLGQQRVVKCFNCQGEGHMARQCRKPKKKRDATWFRDKVLLVEAQGSAKAILMANLSSYKSDVLFEVPHSENTHNDMINQTVQDINSSAQQDAMILSMFEQLSNQVTNCNKVNKDNLIANESLSAELERYKERVKLLEERQNMDLSTREKLLMDDIIQEKNAHFSNLEQHCIYLELAMQLNKEIFQKNNIFVNQTEPSFNQLFELNNLKAELQKKDITIEKLKANIKRLNKTSTTNSVKKDIDEIETINIELEHRVTKLIAENEHLKQTYKQLYDSIKPSCVRAKAHAESKFKGKDIVDNAAQVSNATTNAPGMEIVEQAKSLNPLDSASYSACKYVKLIQELLGYVRDTCPDIHKPSEKFVVVTLINKKKTVRFAEPIISLSTSQKQLGSSQTKNRQATNNYVSTSTGVSWFTKSSRSKSTDNTKNARIMQISSSTQKKNKVEDHSRIVKSCFNKPNCVVESSGNANVQHSKLNTNSKLMCIKCNSSMFDVRHELCFLEFFSDMNPSSKSKSVKKAKKKEEWKSKGKVITATNKVPLREHIPLEVVAQESVVTKVYTRRPKVPRTNGSISKPSISKSVISNKTEPDTSRGSHTSVAPSSSFIDLGMSKLFCGIWTSNAQST